jgi:predicted RNA binding protein YcfA (HicA-like mRNA interferase family)
MVVKLKTLSGLDLVKIFEQFGFVLVSQKGSHIKIRRLVLENRETLIIPNRDPIKSGTLKSIFNQAVKYINKDELSNYFYTKN